MVAATTAQTTGSPNSLKQTTARFRIRKTCCSQANLSAPLLSFAAPIHGQICPWTPALSPFLGDPPEGHDRERVH